jgi:hypothetical protein
MRNLDGTLCLERDTENAEVQQQNQSLPSLFGRLTDELTQLFDPKLESVKGGVQAKGIHYAVLEPVGHRFTGCRHLSQLHIARFAEPTTGISSIGLGTTNHPTLHGV